jgi:hypothetical protein
MTGSGASATATLAALRTAWKAATPTRQDFGAFVSELQSMQMVGEGSIFERGAHVPVTHMAFFMPPATASLSELKSKDRRSAKEWEYVNAAGVWLELGQAALAIVKDRGGFYDDGGDGQVVGHGGQGFGAAREVLAMRGQYFADVVQYGVEAARQMAFLVEQSHDAVHSLSHRSVRESLNQRLESEAAKLLAKTHLQRASGSGAPGSGGAENTGSGSSAGGAAADG